MQPETGLRTWQWVVTAIVVIVLIVIGVMIFSKKSPSAPAATDETVATTDKSGNINTIIVSDQYPGNVVYVSSVQLAKGGWVEIHKDNAGQPGAIIGSAWVDAGVNPVKITVTSPIVDGSTYYAMLHSDDGDKKFDAAKDLPMKDSKGNIIMQIFHGSASAGSNVKG